MKAKKLLGALVLALGLQVGLTAGGLPGIGAGGVACAAPKTLLYVPLDNRPVNCAYAVETLRAAGWDVLLPPAEAIAAQEHQGQPEALLDWLEAHAHEAQGAVVSTDAVLYGGLVDSRTHHIDPEVLLQRQIRLTTLREKHPNTRLYGFATVMRSPRASSAPVEPAYYGQYGGQIFRMGQLRDRAELGLLSGKERRELAQLECDIPQDVQQDNEARRATNLAMTRLLVVDAGLHKFNTLVIGRDDSSRYSQAHREARALARDVAKMPRGAVHFFAGADEIGLLLLTRAVNELTYTTPIVYPFYADGTGASTICQYEDEPIGRSVREHILVAGGYPAQLPDNADHYLGVFVMPESGSAESTSANNFVAAGPREINFVARAKALLAQGKPVTVADVAFGNGSSNPLVYQLFAQQVAVPAQGQLTARPDSEQPVGWALSAYGGWNTASNAMGFALAQGLLALQMTPAGKQDLLARRYLEDFGYQSNVRMQVYQQLVWPQGRANSGLTTELEQEYTEGITQRMLPVTQPVLGDLATQYTYTLPWHRLFEVQVEKKGEAKK